MMLVQALATTIARAIDANHGDVPARIRVSTVVRKVLIAEINEIRSIMDQDPLTERDTLFVRGIVVDEDANLSPWVIEK